MPSLRVVIVTESFAKRYFPDGRVLGRRILVQSSNQALAEIIGFVGDVRHNELTSDPAPTVYLVHAQTPGYIGSLVVRTSGDPVAHATALRRAVHEVDPTQAVSGVGTIEQDVAKVLARPRLQAALVTGFAVIAVVLAVIGVYGLIAYVVTLRTHEIGIRLRSGRPGRKSSPQDCFDVRLRRHDRRPIDVSGRCPDVLRRGACSRHHSGTPRISD
jgi:putative ABC transport system permease protein